MKQFVPGIVMSYYLSMYSNNGNFNSLRACGFDSHIFTTLSYIHGLRRSRFMNCESKKDGLFAL